MINGVIFDMDGVMIDSEQQSNRGWLAAAKKQGVEMPMWLIDSFKGAPNNLSKGYFDDYFKGKIDYWETRQMRTDYVHELRKTEGIPVKYGLYTLLSAIRSRGLKCAVATSTQRKSAEKTLNEIGAMSYLDAVVFGDEVENGKPAPDIFLKAARDIGVDPSECIVVEDSINGIKAGYAAAMKVVHIPDTIRIDDDIKALTTVVCHNLTQVVDVIDYFNGQKPAIDMKQVKEAFDSYTNAYNPKDDKIRLKISHTYRVADLCYQIALSKGLDDYDALLCRLMGILHDIGRFEQVRRYGTFMDSQSVNHGELGADILFKDGAIVSFLPSIDSLRGLEEWKILEAAVRFHSVYRLPEGLSKREEMFCNILRDADKVDIFRVISEEEPEVIYDTSSGQMLESSVSEEVMESIRRREAVLKSIRKTPADIAVGHISLAFELVYPSSVEIAICQGYLGKMLDFTSNNSDTEKKFKEIREIVRDFINSKLTAE